MKGATRAGVELHASIMRYAEVERYGERSRLLRLGSCAFDFDVADLVRGGKTEQLTLFREAVEDVFAGSEADELSIAVHPPVSDSFFAPVAADTPAAQREEELRRQAAYLLDMPSEGDVHVASEVLYTEPVDGEAADWLHVLALPASGFAPFDVMLGELPFGTCRVQTSTQAAANMLNRLETPPEREDTGTTAYRIGLGVYTTHFEFIFCRNGNWHFASHAPAGPAEDGCYYLGALLNRMRLAPADVQDVFVYGQDPDPASFNIMRDLLSVVPQRLDALRVLDYEQEGLSEGLTGEVYLPAIGLIV